MNELIIKTKDGKVYKGKFSMHFMVAELHEVDLDEVVEVGFITKDREVWLKRKPH